MSFSKAKLKRFNDVNEPLGPAVVTPTKVLSAEKTPQHAHPHPHSHPERREQIEKFFKDAVRFASGAKHAKDATTPTPTPTPNKEDKKSKGLRLFRTPSLPHRLRFRQNLNIAAAAAATTAAASEKATEREKAAASTPLKPAKSIETPNKGSARSSMRLKGKDALQQELHNKDDIIENYAKQIDALKRHVEQLKDSEQKLREENRHTAACNYEDIIRSLTSENAACKETNEKLSFEINALTAEITRVQAQLKLEQQEQQTEVQSLKVINDELKAAHGMLELQTREQIGERDALKSRVSALEGQLSLLKKQLTESDTKLAENVKLIESLKASNEQRTRIINEQKAEIEKDKEQSAQELKNAKTEIDLLKKERNSLKQDLANKCALIKALQDELLDKNCEIDAHCDTIRELCREKAAKYAENAENERLSVAAVAAAEATTEIHSDIEKALEREKAFWRAELDKRQKQAENEIIKIELEKQDVMMILETTNDMLRERDEKIQKYEEQLMSKGIDYYVKLVDTLQKQAVDLKQDLAKTITEKYNYQLTLTNTRATVNILMERLKQSDADVERYSRELESMTGAKHALESCYDNVKRELAEERARQAETKEMLARLEMSAQALRNEVAAKEQRLNQILTSEDETLTKFGKIASSFQERIDAAASASYMELHKRDECRTAYMQDMKKALDELSIVLQSAQSEFDQKEQLIAQLRAECAQLKIENLKLKSKLEDAQMNMNLNTTDMEKIEGMLLLVDSAAAAAAAAGYRKDVVWQHENNDSAATTPNSATKQKMRTTPVGTPKTTPKKAGGAALFFAGKENIPSPPPQKQILKVRNI